MSQVTALPTIASSQPGRRVLRAHLFERHPDDWYVEPKWCDRVLFEKVQFFGTITDPFCGLGRVLDAAALAGYLTFGCDIADRGARKRHPFQISDFLSSNVPFRNIVSNPPYKYGIGFIAQIVERAQFACALLLRSSYANASENARVLRAMPLERVLAISPRPSMPPGPVLQAAQENARDENNELIRVGGGREDFAWYVFRKGHEGPVQFDWLEKPAKTEGDNAPRPCAGAGMSESKFDFQSAVSNDDLQREFEEFFATSGTACIVVIGHDGRSKLWRHPDCWDQVQVSMLRAALARAMVAAPELQIPNVRWPG